MPPRKKNGEPEILQHTSIRMENGEVLRTGDEPRLRALLKDDELDRLQNEHGAVSGFVQERKGAAEAPMRVEKTNAGSPLDQ